MNHDLSLSPATTLSRLPSTFEPRASRQEREFRLIDLWKIIRRRSAVLVWTTLAFLVLGALYCAFVPRLYRAEAQLQVLKQNSAAFLGDSAQASASAAADALDFNLAAQTQVDVMKSRNIALSVIEEMHLQREQDYQVANDPEENGKLLLDSPKRLDHVLKLFEKRLNASSVPGTRLLSVSFLDRDPKRAEQIVSAIVSNFVAYNSQVQFNASSDATKLLSADLTEMKAKVDAAQAEVVRLQQQSGIYGVDETNNATNAKLEQLNAQLTVAQANRTLKQSVYSLAKTRSPEVLSGMIGATGTGANTMNAPIQMLRQQQSDAAAAYAELSAHYGPEYPKVQQARERMKAIQASTDAEITRLVGQAQAEYNVASATEAGAESALNEQKALAVKMNHDAILYTSAKHDADTSRSLYEELQKRLKEADIVAGLHANNLNILDPAIVPVALAQPRWILDLTAAVAAGLFAGFILLFLIDALDSTVRDPQELEDLSGLPVLALIPPADSALSKDTMSALRRATFGDRWSYMATARAPRSAVAESFRGLRSSILSHMPGTVGKAIAVTSSSEGEGKSFTTVNLGAAFAQSGRSVLVVDGDLHKRTLSIALGIDDLSGLREVVGKMPWQDAVVAARETTGLFMLSSGAPTDRPADIIASAQMASTIRQLRSAFDIVLIDTPSTLDVADTLCLSSAVDALIVIAKSGRTAQHALTHTLKVLHRSHARVLGIVLNGIHFKSSDYFFYCGKRSGSYDLPKTEIISPVRQISPTHAAVALLVVLSCVSTNQARAQQAPAVTPDRLHAPYSPTTRTTDDAPLPITTANDAEQNQKVVLGPGDLIAISVYDAPELAQETRVNANGDVHLLLLGDVPANGLQADQLANKVEVLLKDRGLISAPHVAIAVKEFTTQGVTIEGEVKKPGVYAVFSERSLLDIIALADGTTATADNEVTIRHKNGGKIEHVTLSQDNGGKLIASDVRVYPGDTIVVPRAGFAYVLGDVQRPGGYIMHDNGTMSVLEVISEAQGTARTASLKHVLLLRKLDGQTQTIPIQLKAIQRGQQPDVPLQAGDVVFIPPSGLKTFGQDTAGIFASVSGAALYTLK